jgi:hypothetical protein
LLRVQIASLAFGRYRIPVEASAQRDKMAAS